MSAPRYPLRLKIGVGAALLAAAPAILVGWLLIDQSTGEVERSLEGLQLALAGDLARTISAFSEQAEADLGTVAQVLTDPVAPADRRLDLAARLLERSRHLDAVAIYDRDGALIDTLRVQGRPSPELLSVPEPLRDQADARGLATGSTRVEASRRMVPLLVPLRADGERTGYALGWAPLDPVVARVLQLHEEHLRPLGGAMWVLDGAGESLAASVGREPPETRAEGVPAGAVSWVTVVGGATVASVPAGEWRAVVAIPRTVAFASVQSMVVTVLVTLTLTLGIAVAAALLFARHLTRPLGRLMRFSEDLAARRFDRRADVATRDELAVLAEAMSRAASELAASEERLRRDAQIRADLGRYLPQELVERVVTRRQDMGLGGGRREVTVVFADVVAFTPVAEQLPPEDTVALLNEIFTVLTELVFRHGGMVDKFVGDCVMAIWGAPEARPDHALRGLAAAEDMLRWLDALNPGLEERYGVRVELAIGVHTGDAVVGNIGSERRMEYTAIGDAVNVAARLETIARPQQILVSEVTREAAGDDFHFADLGERTLPGRREPLRLFEVRW